MNPQHLDIAIHLGSAWAAGSLVGAERSFQRKMERYWSLRWLAQEGITECGATVRRGQNIKLDHLPLLLPLPSLPSDVLPGQRVKVSLGEQNLISLSIDCRYLSTIAGTVEDFPDDEEEVVPPEVPTESVAVAGEGANEGVSD